MIKISIDNNTEVTGVERMAVSLERMRSSEEQSIKPC